MNALIKSSIGLVLLTAIAVYLYLAPGDKSFDAARSQPQDAICKQDGERLARLRARPSLDEGLRFAGEISVHAIVAAIADPSGRSQRPLKIDRLIQTRDPAALRHDVRQRRCIVARSDVVGDVG